MSEVFVSMPLHLSTALLKAVRNDPLTSIDDKDEMNMRIGWLICAWDVLVEARSKESAATPIELRKD